MYSIFECFHTMSTVDYRIGSHPKSTAQQLPSYSVADDVFDNIRFNQIASVIDDQTETTVTQTNHGRLDIATT